MKKWLLILFYAAVLVVGLLHIDLLMSWINREDASQLAYMFPIAVFLGLFPVLPYSVFAGMMGAKFGTFWGAFINWTGGFGSALLMFLYVRYGYQQAGRAFLARFGQLNRFTDTFERNAFLAILFARLIPVVPSPMLTIYAAISRVPLIHFALATGIGKIPAILLYTFVGNQLFRDLYQTCLTVLLYGSFVGIVYLIYKRWQARHAKKSHS